MAKKKKDDLSPIHLEIGDLRKATNQRDDALLDMMIDANAPTISAFGNDFSERMAIQCLIEETGHLIGMEIYKKRGTLAYSFEEEKERYVAMRQKIKASLGKRFEKVYKEMVDQHNECHSRDGFILPEMNDDGTHGPLAEAWDGYGLGGPG